MVDNREFLEAIFGEEWGGAHVTSFYDDPSDIAEDRRGVCWTGGFARDRLDDMEGGENQYFAISLFECDTRAMRRKSLFDACFVVVADDVREKLPLDRVKKLPAPSYKLLTSAGSEQWGWILEEACETRSVVEALLDGLVEQGLAPDGVDPGMRGVTRYVRLPGGTNTKASRGNFKCQLIEWAPGRLYSIDELADVFGIDLTPKADVLGEVDVANMPDHPIWGQLRVTGQGGDGWVRVDCPNAEAHSSGDASGAAVRILTDGSVNFKCHHGHCFDLTGGKVVKMLGLAKEVEGFMKRVAHDGLVAVAEKLGLRGGDDDEIDGDEVGKVFDPKRYIYIAEKNKFWDCKTRVLIPPAGLDNRYLSVVPRVKGRGVSDVFFQGMGLDDEADGFMWKPTGWARPQRSEVVCRVGGRRLINEWAGLVVKPAGKVFGNVMPWLKHAEYLFPDEREREVVLDYLACMVQRLAVKPSFWIVHRGAHRVGKDMFYQPLMRGMGDAVARMVHIDKLLDGWGDYIRGLRFCVVTELDKAQDKKVANAMKVVCAGGASEYRTLNLKGGAVVSQFDCLGGVMMSNKRHCLAVEKGDKRYFVVDSYVDRLDDQYYVDLFDWYSRGGVSAVMGYLGHRDISGFNPHTLPFETPGLAELVEGGKYDYEQNIDEMVEDKVGLFARDWFKNAELKAYAKQCGWKCGNNGLVVAVEGAGFVKVIIQKKIDGVVHTKGRFWVRQELLEKGGVKGVFDQIDSSENEQKSKR